MQRLHVLKRINIWRQLTDTDHRASHGGVRAFHVTLKTNALKIHTNLDNQKKSLLNSVMVILLCLYWIFTLSRKKKLKTDSLAS